MNSLVVALLDDHRRPRHRRELGELSGKPAFDATLALGGTLTGEHGVRLLKPYLDRQLGDAERALMARVKAAFDPAGLLNPGKALQPHPEMWTASIDRARSETAMSVLRDVYGRSPEHLVVTVVQEDDDTEWEDEDDEAFPALDCAALEARFGPGRSACR